MSSTLDDVTRAALPPTVVAWLDPVEARERLVAAGLPVRAARRTYVRLKPDLDAILQFDLDVEGASEPIPAYVLVLPAARAAEVASKMSSIAAPSPTLGPGSRLLASGDAVLFLFPNDRQLRGLRFVAEPDKLKRLLGTLPAFTGLRVRASHSTFTPVRWKPERRFLLRAALALKDDATGAKSAADVFVRFFADERGARIERTATSLRAAGLDDLVPEPLGVLDDGRLFVERTVPGERALDAVLAGRGDTDALAAALVRLHATTVDLPNAPAVITRLATLAEEWEPALRIDADLRALVGPLLDRLRAEAPRGGLQATVHGDLHLQQVLERAGRVGLVDWECAARGDPLFDLGWFAAQRDAVPLRDPAALDRVHRYFDAVLAGYEARAAWFDAPRLAFWTKLCGASLALLPFRRLERDWRAAVRARVLSLER